MTGNGHDEAKSGFFNRPARWWLRAGTGRNRAL
jgi:hypothetical protein